MPSAGLVSETQVMRQEGAELSGPLGPIELRQAVPFEPCEASDAAWVGGPGGGSLPCGARLGN